MRRGRHTSLLLGNEMCQLRTPALSDLSFVFSFLYLWPNFHLLFVISHPRCSFSLALCWPPSFAPGVITITETGAGGKGWEKLCPPWILISFPRATDSHLLWPYHWQDQWAFSPIPWLLSSLSTASSQGRGRCCFAKGSWSLLLPIVKALAVCFTC